MRLMRAAKGMLSSITAIPAHIALPTTTCRHPSASPICSSPDHSTWRYEQVSCRRCASTDMRLRSFPRSPVLVRLLVDLQLL